MALRQPSRTVRDPTEGRGGPLTGRGLLTGILAAAFLWSLLSVDWGRSLPDRRGIEAAGDIAGALFRPDLSPGILRLAFEAGWRTLAYATAGVTLAVVLAVPLGVLASGVLVRRWLPRLMLAGGARAFLAFLRSIHELVWAWLFVAAIGLSPWAAVLAIALPYAGILGRVLADMLNDVPPSPLQSLRSSGADQRQLFLYGRLPLVFADALGYTLYRWECGIRSAAIMSFVGLGGLGYQIQVSLDDLRYEEVWTFVLFIVAMVVAVDLWSSALRKRLVE